jgi:hypothetical protein
MRARSPGLSALNALLDRLAAEARRTFLEEGAHPVTAWIYLPGGPPFRFEAPSGSAENLELIRRLFEMAARGGAEACGLVAEGWRVEGVERAVGWRKRGRSLADMPGRAEVLTVQAVSPAGQVGRCYRVRRAGARVVLQQPDDDPEALVFSRLVTNLPWPVRPAETRTRPRRRSPP